MHSNACILSVPGMHSNAGILSMPGMHSNAGIFPVPGMHSKAGIFSVPGMPGDRQHRHSPRWQYCTEKQPRFMTPKYAILLQVEV